jgi:protein-L-isoaspartate(D-aspartate) O-methyltransferase
MIDFADARRKMVDSQLRPVDVNNFDLLTAMAEVPRERFVPADKAAIAYLDRDVPVLENAGKPVRCLPRPAVAARLIQAVQASRNDRALVVGCATGYAAAVLARLAGEVVALEEDARLAAQAREALPAVGAAGVKVVTGPLPAGWPGAAPYDVILVDGAVEVEPTALLAQLGEGGRLAVILGKGGAGSAMVYRLNRGDVSAGSVFNAAAPALPGFEKPAAFVF